MLRTSGPKAKAASNRKKRRADVPLPEIPLPSRYDVRSVMEVGGIGSEHRRLVEQFLCDLHASYLRELDDLGWNASDKQIEAGLTKVRKRAEALSKALENKAIRDKLLTSHICSDQLPSTNYEECQRFCEKFDAYIAGVVLIRDYANVALKRHDVHAKISPNQTLIPTAKKPELPRLVEEIVEFWTEKFGREEAGDDARQLLSFCVAIFDCLLSKTHEENAIRALLSKARKSRDLKHRISEVGVKKK